MAENNNETINLGFYRQTTAPEHGQVAHAWILTHDYIEDGEYNQVGTNGPSEATDEATTAVKTPGSHRIAFDMYDDDGIKYYSGYFTMDDNYTDTYFTNSPLYDFGLPNAGATEIRYPDKPEWNETA